MKNIEKNSILTRLKDNKSMPMLLGKLGCGGRVRDHMGKSKYRQRKTIRGD